MTSSVLPCLRFQAEMRELGGGMALPGLRNQGWRLETGTHPKLASLYPSLSLVLLKRKPLCTIKLSGIYQGKTLTMESLAS